MGIYKQGFENRRYFQQELKVDPGRIVGGFVSYDTQSRPIPKNDGSGVRFIEALDRGCFTGAVGKFLPILLNHDSTKKLGDAKIHQSDAGVSFTLQLDDSDLADELIEGIKTHRIGGVSPAFFVDQERWPSDDYRVVESAQLREISFVDMPCYVGTCASIQNVRSDEREKKHYIGLYHVPQREIKLGL